MPIDMNTHGLDWRKHVRESEIFTALITDNWHKDARAKRQYAYAREIGKPIALLVKQGTRLPDHADAHTWRVWTTVEELAELVAAVEEGRSPFDHLTP